MVEAPQANALNVQFIRKSTWQAHLRATSLFVSGAFIKLVRQQRILLLWYAPSRTTTSRLPI